MPINIHERDIKISSRLGFHLKAVARFVQAAVLYPCAVLVFGGAAWVNGKSLFQLARISSRQGRCITVRTEGMDSLECLNALEGPANFPSRRSRFRK